MEVIGLSRQIMEYLKAFKGSKPVVHNNEAMLIRGKSTERLTADEMEPKLEQLFKDLNIKKVETNSEKASKLTDQVDQTFRNTTEVYDESNGVAGIERMKQSFEITGFQADYIIGYIEDIAVYIVLYFDKSGFGPMFVESMVVRVKDDEIN